MTLEELRAIVGGGEQTQVEFKKTTGQRTDAAKAACGMLNGAGGFVFFGVTDAGEVQGQDVTAGTLEDVVRELRSIEPLVPIEPETVRLPNGRCVIALRVPAGGGGPFTYDGRPYVRQGPTTQQMAQDEYRRRLLEQMHPGQRWELLPAQDVSLVDLDAGEITRTVDEAVRRGRLDEPGTRDPAALLRGLGVMRDATLLNAAVALFLRSDRPYPAYGQCSMRLARFRGTTMGEFEDSRELQGSLFELLRLAQVFMRQHLPVAGRIVPTLFERVDDPIYPPEALREALANALCHRDYALFGGSVSVAIFDDRLEIASPGGLHFGLTPEDLSGPHTSQPWNPAIARVLFLRGVIEQWGRGTLKMGELTERAGLAPPEFEERTGDLVVRFRPTQYVAPRRVERDLSPLQREVLGIVGALGVVSLADVRRELVTPAAPRTLQETLSALRTLGLISSSGRGRGARWRLR